MRVRRVVQGAGLVLALLVGLRLVAAVIWPTINDVTTGATPQYPDLQPQRFAPPVERVFEAAVASARALGWEVTGQDRPGGEIRAVATTTLLRFKDDVTVTVRPEAGAVRVDVRSRSRIGKGDLGTNARRIRRFQEDLRRRLPGG